VLIAAVARKLGVHRQSAQRIVRDLQRLATRPLATAG
jgi:plasmid maintenance system antidote protein VapI